jgi:hypothetical protein
LATYETSRTQVGEPVPLFATSPAQTNNCLVLSADARFYLTIPFVIFMLQCVYNSLFYIWTYQIRNSVTDSSLKEWPLKCTAEIYISVDVDINLEEFNYLM